MMIEKVAWAILRGGEFDMCAGEMEWARPAAKAAVEAHEAALSEKGLVIVPREPTEAMQRAVYICSMVPPGMTEEHARCLYRAMLAVLEGKE